MRNLISDFTYDVIKMFPFYSICIESVDAVHKSKT